MCCLAQAGGPRRGNDNVPFWQILLKSRKLRGSQNLAKADVWTFLPLQRSLAPIRRPVVILCETIWSLTPPRPKRISGPKRFYSSPKKDFFNTIGTKRTWRDVWHRSGRFKADIGASNNSGGWPRRAPALRIPGPRPRTGPPIGGDTKNRRRSLSRN
jgi:hypothetical protein